MRKFLFVSLLLMTCKSFGAEAPPALPVDPALVQSVRPLPVSTAASIKEQVIVQGLKKDGRFVVTEVITGNEKSHGSKPPMPFQMNMLPAMQAQTFGVEERAKTIVKGDNLTLSCKAGSKPAGVALTGPWYLPKANAELRISVSGKGDFELLIADQTHSANEQPLSMGQFKAGKAVRQISLPLPSKGLEPYSWHSFSIACPGNEAELIISDIQLQPLSGAAPARSAWLWDFNAWLSEP